MERKNDEQMIYLKDLLFTALYGFRGILAVALILAVVLGGFTFVSGSRSETTPAAIAKYEQDKAVAQQQVDQLKTAISGQEDYIRNSVFLKLDPYGHYEAAIKIYVKTDYQILPGMSYQNPDKTDAVVSAYEAQFSTGEAMTAYAEVLKTDSRYVEELMTVKSDLQADVLEIGILCLSQEQATQLLQLLEKQLQTGKTQISQSVCQHEVALLEKTAQNRSTPSLADNQKKETSRVEELKTALSKAQANLAAVKAPNVGGADLKKTVVMAVLGAVVGAFLTACVLFVAHIASGKVYSGRTLTNRTGVKIIGAMEHAPRKCCIDRCLRKWEGRSAGQDALTAIATDISCRAEGAGYLLITGSTGKADRETLVTAIAQAMPNTKVEDAGNLTEATALPALKDCDRVVLVEKCGVSRYDTVSRQMEIVEDYNKQLIGCVVLDG